MIRLKQQVQMVCTSDRPKRTFTKLRVVKLQNLVNKLGPKLVTLPKHETTTGGQSCIHQIKPIHIEKKKIQILSIYSSKTKTTHQGKTSILSIQFVFAKCKFQAHSTKNKLDIKKLTHASTQIN